MSASNIKLLENYIDYCSAKSQIVSKNIANMGTENYQRQDVKFISELDREMNAQVKVTNARHFENSNFMDGQVKGFEIIVDRKTDMISGMNNIDIDKEMAELAENTIRFKFASKKISAHYKSLQKVIRGV